MQVYTKIVRGNNRAIIDLGARRISNNTFTHRVAFEPIPGQTGLYAVLDSPGEGYLRSFAMMAGADQDATLPPASGSLLVTPMNPTVDYEAAFLYAVLDHVPLTTVGPLMWRQTDISNAAFSTNQLDQGRLYLILLGAPAGFRLADVTMTTTAD
jgi:hypothetical protein